MTKPALTLGAMPLKNMRAHPVRTIVLLLLAAAQAACVFSGVVLTAASQADLELAEERLGADVVMYPFEASYYLDMDTVVMQGTPVASYAHRSILARVDDCEGISAVTHQVYVPGPADGPAWLVAFDADTDFVLGPWVDEAAGALPAAGSVMIGANVEAPEGEVEVYGRTWPVGAHLKKMGSELDDAVFFGMGDMCTAVADAQAAGVEEARGLDPLSDFSALLIRVDEGADVESVANWLKVYVTKAKTVSKDAALTSTSSSVAWQSGVIGAVAVIAWVVLLIALSVAQSIAIRERAPELSVWRAAGASRKVVRRATVREAVMANAAGAVVGVVIAACVAWACGVMLAPAPCAAAALSAIALSVLAGWAATSYAVRKVTGEEGAPGLVAV